MIKALRFTLITIVGLFLASLFLWAGAMGLADLAEVRGDGVVARHERGDPLSYEDWNAAYQAYLYAAKIHPLSGANEDKLGRLLELWASSDARQETPARDLQREALEHFRAAAKRRPTWPFSRFVIVRLKAKLGLIDAELMSNLRTAADLAPMVQVVQEPLMDLGFVAWDLLDKQTRDAVLAIIDRNLLLNPRRAIQHAIGYRRVDLIEGRLDADPALALLYRDLARASKTK